VNIREELLREHSKPQTDRIVAYVGENVERFAQLMACFFDEDKLLSQRAGWPMSDTALVYPSLFEPYLKSAIANLKKPHLHDAVIRNTLRVTQYANIPEEMQSELVDLALGYVENPKATPAIKAFSIGTLTNICQQYPELAQEVKLVLGERMEYESPAFISRAKAFIKAF
jgi:hypothetical protein